MKNVTTNDDRRRTLSPAARVLDGGTLVTVKIEMPGVAKSDLEIRVEGRELTVVGRRADPVSRGTWLLRERMRGDFQRTYTVDASIDMDKVDAKLAHGVLTLTFPVKDAAQPRRIDIRSA